jgi:hypothetical protein
MSRRATGTCLATLAVALVGAARVEADPPAAAPAAIPAAPVPAAIPHAPVPAAIPTAPAAAAIPPAPAAAAIPPAPAPAAVPTTPAAAIAPAEPIRSRDASLGTIVAGPFRSSRLFTMPVADVIGAYQLSVSGDGSLLQETGILSATGALVVGFGDIAQLEYRHTAAISIDHTTAPVPAVGVQLKIPLRPRAYVPAWAIAFRLGVPRRETFGAISVDESVTDLYVVGRLALWGPLAGVTLHGGARVSSAQIAIAGDQPFAARRVLVLPAAGWEVQTTSAARFVGELALAPQFEFDRARPAPPRIRQGVLGRLGIRWFIHPALTIDASLGYQLEVAAARVAEGPSAVVQWDIRLGAEVFVPWGALVCRATGVFCDEARKERSR